MPLIIDKLLRALLTLYVLNHFSKELNNDFYSDFIYDTFILSIIVVTCNLSYRSFVLLGNKPVKKDQFFIYFIYTIGIIILVTLKNQWWFAIFFLPLSKLSYYVEKDYVKQYFSLNYIFLIIAAFLTLYSSKFYFLLVIPSIFPSLIFILNRHRQIWKNYKPHNLTNFATPLIVNTILIVTYTKIDVFFIEYFIKNTEFKASYFNSVKLVDYAIMLPVVFISYSFRDWSSGIVKVYNDYRMILIFSLIGTLIAITSTPFIQKILQSDKMAYVYYCVVLPFIVLNTIRNQIYLLNNENWKITHFSVLALLLNIILSYSLYHLNTSNYDFLYATITTQFVLAIFSFGTIKRNKSLIIHKK